MKKLELNITKITIVIRDNFCDKIYIDTTLPSPINESNLALSFETQPTKGRDYVLEHFGIKPEIIEARVSKHEYLKRRGHDQTNMDSRTPH